MPTHLLLNTISWLTWKLRKVFIYFQHLPEINIFNLDPSYYFSHHSIGEWSKVAHILVLKRSIWQFHLHCSPPQPHGCTWSRPAGGCSAAAQGAGHHPAPAQTAHDLPGHEGPGALRKPILLLPLYQACLLPGVREGGGSRMREKGKRGRAGAEQKTISFTKRITSLIVNASIRFYLPWTRAHL